jgi:glycosyltransferase involved in cell wall biosynthesis
MANPDQRVSVIIPVHNGERYLGETLASVLGQDIAPAEIIVVDDGSTDGSVAVAKSFAGPLRCISQPRSGPAAARNRGVAEATQAMLAFNDADDLWPQDRLARQFAHLHDHPELEMVLGQVDQFISPELVGDESLRKVKLLPRMPGFLVGAMLIREEAWLRLGPFDETLRAGEFVAWFLSAMEKDLHYAVIDDLVLSRRLHGVDMMAHNRDAQSDYLKIVRARMLRESAREEVGVGKPAGTRS